ncbi:MAG: NADAR family protein, partial [Alistipes sp.]|nr:NADAR family protein [Alistipes sp.]
IKRAGASYTFDLNFDTIQSHDTTQVDCWAFKTSKDTKGGITLDLGNQCSGYPFTMNGHTFHTSESAYLCGQFSNNTAQCQEVQQRLLRETNGYTAKKYIKNTHKALIREDWETFRAEWMLYVIWSKCKDNTAFAEKLKQIPREAVIIENSTTVHEGTNVYWGCINQEIEQARDKVAKYTELKYQNDIRLGKIRKKDVDIDAEVQRARDKIQHIGTFSNGRNYMGKILKRCQLALLDEAEPQIDYDLLQSKQIYLFGELLRFDV